MSDPTPAPGEVIVPRVAPLAIQQIAVGSHNERDYLFALAVDGTLWRLSCKLGEQWILLPPLPAVGQTAPAGVPIP